MKWLGMQRRTALTDERPGAAHWAINNRLGREGENARRNGKAATSVPKQTGAVLNIQPPIGPSGGIIVFPTGGVINGYQDPLALWDDTKLPAAITSWAFAPSVPPVNWPLPDGHHGGSVILMAYTGGTTPSMDGEGVIFTVLFDAVPVYVSACMDNGSDTVPIPATVDVVSVTAVYGCIGGPEPTNATVSASGT